MSLDQRPSLNIKDILDAVVRRNFQNLKEYFVNQGQLLDFQFLTVTFGGAEANRKISHSLGIVPKDIIVSMITGSGSCTFQLGKFTANEIYLSASGPCTVRFFLGNAAKDATSSFASSDVMVVTGAVATSSGNTSVAGTAFNQASFLAYLDLYLPIGSCYMVPGMTNTLPENLRFAEGGTFKTSDFPTLATRMWDTATSKWFNGGTAVGPTDATGVVNLPDMRGVVPRGLDTRLSGALDPDASSRIALPGTTGSVVGAKPGTYQDDTVQDHVHNYFTNNAPPLNFSVGSHPPRTRDTGGINTQVSGMASGKPGVETRMRNMAWRWVIRVK